MLLPSIRATKRCNRTGTRRGIKSWPHHPPFRWWLAAWRFRAARWRGVANTTKLWASPCFCLQFEPLSDAIRQAFTPQWLTERVLLCHQKSHRRRRFWRVFGLPAILPISVHPTYVHIRGTSSDTRKQKQPSGHILFDWLVNSAKAIRRYRLDEFWQSPTDFT